MKRKKIVFKKEVVTNLRFSEMNNLKGGLTYDDAQICGPCSSTWDGDTSNGSHFTCSGDTNCNNSTYPFCH